MKKIFVLSLPGTENKLLVADSQEEAFERRSEVDPSYDYLPVNVAELEIEGYDVHATLKKEKREEADPITPEIYLDKPPEQLKQTKKKQSKK